MTEYDSKYESRFFYIDDGNSIMLGPIHSSDFIIQCIIPVEKYDQNFQ